MQLKFITFYQAGETILLVRKEDDHWLVGKAGDKEGLFPANFIDVKCEIPVEVRI